MLAYTCPCTLFFYPVLLFLLSVFIPCHLYSRIPCHFPASLIPIICHNFPTYLFSVIIYRFFLSSKPHFIYSVRFLHDPFSYFDLGCITTIYLPLLFGLFHRLPIYFAPFPSSLFSYLPKLFPLFVFISFRADSLSIFNFPFPISSFFIVLFFSFLLTLILTDFSHFSL